MAVRLIVIEISMIDDEMRVMSVGWVDKEKNLRFSEWGCSSVGRALDLHSRGLGFNSPQLHFLHSFTIQLLMESNMQSSLFLAVPSLASLRLHLALHVVSMVQQHALGFFFLIFFLLLFLLRNCLLLYFQLEAKDLRHELLSLEIRFEVWIGLYLANGTMIRR